MVWGRPRGAVQTGVQGLCHRVMVVAGRWGVLGDPATRKGPRMVPCRSPGDRRGVLPPPPRHSHPHSRKHMHAPGAQDDGAKTVALEAQGVVLDVQLHFLDLRRAREPPSPVLGRDGHAVLGGNDAPPEVTACCHAGPTGRHAAAHATTEPPPVAQHGRGAQCTASGAGEQQGR